MKNNLHVFLGATVADAAARPLHWVYNQKKLNSYIKGKKDFSFLKKNKSPFYNIKTGKVSGYNEIGQVMFETLLESHENIKYLRNYFHLNKLKVHQIGQRKVIEYLLEDKYLLINFDHQRFLSSRPEKGEIIETIGDIIHRR